MRIYTHDTIIVILVLLWLLGTFVYPVGGGLIHVLLLVVTVVLVLRLWEGRRVLD